MPTLMVLRFPLALLKMLFFLKKGMRRTPLLHASEETALAARPPGFYVMLCYVIWLFVKRLSQEAIQRRSQRDRLVKIKVFKLRRDRDADDIPCNITLRSAGGESFHSAGPTTAKARYCLL